MVSVESLLISLGCSSAGAVVARLVTHPLDTIKTRIQTSAGSRRSIVHTFQRIQSQGGSRALYRGLPIALLVSVPALSLYLWVYDTSKQVLAEHWTATAADSFVLHGLCACLAELSSGVLWTPMEVVKNKQQGSSYQDARSTGQWILAIYRSEGLRGFFRGYFLGLGVFLPYTVVYFTTYERLKSGARRLVVVQSDPTSRGGGGGGPLPPWVYLSCSGLSSALGAGLSNAVDVVKTRVQVQGGTLLSTVRSMWAKENGLRAFTKGMGARILWLSPSVMISMTLYESLKNTFLPSPSR